MWYVVLLSHISFIYFLEITISNIIVLVCTNKFFMSEFIYTILVKYQTTLQIMI